MGRIRFARPADGRGMTYVTIAYAPHGVDPQVRSSFSLHLARPFRYHLLTSIAIVNAFCQCHPDLMQYISLFLFYSSSFACRASPSNLLPPSVPLPFLPFPFPCTSRLSFQDADSDLLIGCCSGLQGDEGSYGMLKVGVLPTFSS